ncbi:titin-like [Ornithodoros turicata]|uniref:titin-like n=1 Tax=Ornithodoros turicata TaxID=34597 RepID=UPI003139621D
MKLSSSSLGVVVLAVAVKLCWSQEGTRDDSHVENVVHKAVADEFSSEILTNRTRAYLSCASGEMVVKLNFSEPFRGITYVDYDKTSPCKFYGDGSKYYELRIPLKGCGTKQEAPRVFINNIIVRFHRSLELEEDEIKTIICRYPPPLAPPPPSIIAPVLEPLPPLQSANRPKLSEVELLLIICALLFLTLLLLGIGIAYYCLKKRNIKVVKKKKGIPSAPASEITKLSGSTMGTLSMFDPIRIPRAMALSTSGSEAALLTPLSGSGGDRSETIPSDYPSESPSSGSEAEEILETRDVMVAAVPVQKSYDNSAFIAEPYPVDAERAESLSSVQISTVYKPTIPRAKSKPYPLDAERAESISSLQEIPVALKAQMAKEQQLHTIAEAEDQLDAERLEESYAAVSLEQGRPPTTYRIAPPVQTRLRRKEEPRPPSIYGSIPDNDNRAASEIMEIVPTARPPSVSTYAPSIYGSIPDNDICSQSELEALPDVRPYEKRPKLTTQTLTDYLINTQNLTEVQEDITKRRRAVLHRPPPPPASPPPPSSPPPESEIPDTSMSEITAIPEMTIVPRKPKITVQNIDEVFVTTEHETVATEHVVKRTRDTTEQLMKIPQSPPQSPPESPPQLDVTIRHYPPTSGEATGRPSSTSPMPSPPPGTARGPLTTTTYETTDVINATSTTDIRDITRTLEETSTLHYQQPPKPSVASITSTPLPQWDVLVRVLSPPTIEGVDELTPDVREKWRTIITEDTVFRTLIHEATTVEEYYRVTHDVRYETLFDSRTWDIIIRVLTYPDYVYPPIQPELRPPRYRKNSDQLPRRKSSLPPVLGTAIPADLRSLPESYRSNSIPDFDMRSMTEIDVDFSRLERESIASSDTMTTGRSIIDRATSEFMEDIPIMEGRRDSVDSYLPVVERLTAHPAEPGFSDFDTDDARSDVTFDIPDLPYGAQGASRTFVERTSHQLLQDVPGGQSRMTSDQFRMQSSRVVTSRGVERPGSVDGREEIKSITEKDVYDWMR